ncbi:nucleotide sugar dehydrogenase [Allofrancisella guangzhouensis]|uniref:UDP-glucose 6-dehydrogenase n=1 Tax=Allofrancisella guangzhouensis TaxID=594679 RepID=A0A0A8E6W5_9GAMM|nr:nucleotide sugar dehydrogenase [Allofrancisella guangzhouensis]AJC49342.1 UDP-glucose 6-dehydrogenase [Allofrancisella guangzhouensis]MBK2043927.1 nucleotide sugar dehydrogenase [Allofrancisella guangzhouensis]MBK2044960.1 nucleotide sugar dehydrogenase [Allofrancisella guangzhouensis]
MNITIVGLGFVGLSNAVLLSQHNDVVAYDIDEIRLKKISEGLSPIEDKDIARYLREAELSLKVTSDKKVAYANANYVVVATPTDYNVENDCFDTSSIESVIQDIIRINKKATIIIKSTVPVGYTLSVKSKFNFDKVIFSPEFLREGKALHDNLYPSRIIMGSNSDEAVTFAGLLARGAIKKDIPILYTGSTEAEAIKLFSNAYLAMRVSYFNELDTYAEYNGLNTGEIISGMSFDPRIGSHYNNPSFGYGGYCFPKDTKQLKANFKGIPNSLINAIVDSNEVKKTHIYQQIMKLKPKVVGIYRLIMKNGSDNYRASAVIGIIEKLKSDGVNMLIYEPTIRTTDFWGIDIINDLSEFKHKSSIIVANRLSDELSDVMKKVYTRDITGEN